MITLQGNTMTREEWLIAWKALAILSDRADVTSMDFQQIRFIQGLIGSEIAKQIVDDLKNGVRQKGQF